MVAAWPEHAMKVIGHQAIGDDAHADAGGCLPHQPHERMIVVLAMKNFGALVAPVHGVIAVAAHGGTSSAWHGAIATSARVACKGRPRAAVRRDRGAIQNNRGCPPRLCPTPLPSPTPLPRL